MCAPFIDCEMGYSIEAVLWMRRVDAPEPEMTDVGVTAMEKMSVSWARVEESC